MEGSQNEKIYAQISKIIQTSEFLASQYDFFEKNCKIFSEKDDNELEIEGEFDVLTGRLLPEEAEELLNDFIGANQLGRVGARLREREEAGDQLVQPLHLPLNIRGEAQEPLPPTIVVRDELVANLTDVEVDRVQRISHVMRDSRREVSHVLDTFTLRKVSFELSPFAKAIDHRIELPPEVP